MKVNTPAISSSSILADSFNLTKPRITLLALVTTAVGIKMAPAALSLPKIFFTFLGVSLLVGGASALNMFLEREVDYRMDRTRDRPLPGKRLTPEYGLGLGCILIGIAIPLLINLVNPLTAWVGFGSMIAYVLVYTPLKKRTSLSLWIGAIPGAAPPLLGWTAATGSLDLPAWILFGIIFFWQIPHFLAIGTFRRQEYQNAGFKIFPLKQRPRTIKFQMVFFSLLLVPLSLSLYWIGFAGEIYFASALALNILFILSVIWRLSGNQEHAWGKRVFGTSLFYLTFLFLILFFDGGPQ
jgi:protoheme IX farnesyltransferase